MQKQASCSPDEAPPPPSVVHLSISMLMPCNDLRHVGMKEEERNLFSAQLCSAFCCCCYSNTGLELKLTQQCLFAWQDRVIFSECWKERVGVNHGKKGVWITAIYATYDDQNCQHIQHQLSYLYKEEIKYCNIKIVINSCVLIYFKQ